MIIFIGINNQGNLRHLVRALFLKGCFLNLICCLIDNRILSIISEKPSDHIITRFLIWELVGIARGFPRLREGLFTDSIQNIHRIRETVIALSMFIPECKVACKGGLEP